MNSAELKREGQLMRWQSRIEVLTDRIPASGAATRFDVLTYLDELKILHATARAKFDEFRSARSGDRAHLEHEMNVAWDELEAAFRSPRPMQ